MSDTAVPSGNRAFDLSNVFFRALYALGVRHVVISPGSRSTPLTLAASTHPDLEKHVILDERSAGFTALGIGKATGRPAVLVCTSGTALANYFPAVIEARMSGVPLLLATADRPPHLVGTGASQTIHQRELYGEYPVYFRDMSEAGGSPDAARRLAGEAMEAMQEERGPAHINFPFDKPLEPSRERLEEAGLQNWEQAEEFTASEAAARSGPAFHRTGSSPPRTVVIMGPLSPFEDPGVPARLADRLNAPLLAECGTGATAARTAITGFEGYLRDPEVLDRLQPDLILRFGFQPLSRGIEKALKAWQEAPHWHLAHPSNTHDATRSTTRRITWHGREEPECRIAPSPPEWLEAWQQEERQFARLREVVLGDSGSAGSGQERGGKLADGHLYHHLLPKVPDEWFVFFSNSFPVRDRLLCGALEPSYSFVNRGASGIDGITSTALGISLGSGRPGVLFTGDLAFLHDTNALLSGRLPDQPLIIIIANNSGGSIFRMLPIAEHGEIFRSYFENPQQADIGKLAGAYGLAYRRIDTAEDLAALDLPGLAKEGNSGAGIHLVECRTDADHSMELRRRLWNPS